MRKNVFFSNSANRYFQIQTQLNHGQEDAPLGEGQGPGDAVRGPEHQGGCQEDGEGQVLDTRPQGEGEERLNQGLPAEPWPREAQPCKPGGGQEDHQYGEGQPFHHCQEDQGQAGGVGGSYRRG